MRSFGMRNTNRRGKGRGSGETIKLYDSGQKQPEDMLQTIKGAAHRDSPRRKAEGKPTNICRCARKYSCRLPEAFFQFQGRKRTDV